MTLFKRIAPAVTASLLLLAFLFLIWTNVLVHAVSSPHILDKPEGESPDYVLVLGAGLNDDGSPGRMLRDRLNTAVALYRHFEAQGSAPTVIVSGDRREGYDEVGAMTAYLLVQEIPANAIAEDPYGFSTSESIANLAMRAPHAKAIIVTQEYHLYRALYLARAQGLDAYGYAAPPRDDLSQIYRDLRETLARAKDVLFSLIPA